VQEECDTSLESSPRELQLCSRLHPNWRFEQRVIVPQSCESPNRGSFGTPPWESWDKKPFGCGAAGRHKEYYMGEGGGFPRVRAVVSLVSPKLPVACPSIKGVPKIRLTNLFIGLMQVRISN